MAISAIYDALGAVAQDFSMSLRFLDGSGQFRLDWMAIRRRDAATPKWRMDKPAAFLLSESTRFPSNFSGQLRRQNREPGDGSACTLSPYAGQIGAGGLSLSAWRQIFRRTIWARI